MFYKQIWLNAIIGYNNGMVLISTGFQPKAALKIMIKNCFAIKAQHLNVVSLLIIMKQRTVPSTCIENDSIRYIEFALCSKDMTNHAAGHPIRLRAGSALSFSHTKGSAPRRHTLNWRRLPFVLFICIMCHRTVLLSAIQYNQKGLPKMSSKCNT